MIKKKRRMSKKFLSTMNWYMLLKMWELQEEIRKAIGE